MKREVLPERLINDGKIYGFIVLVFQEYTSKNQDFSMTFSAPSNFRTFQVLKKRKFKLQDF